MPHRPAEVIDMTHLGEAESQAFLRPWTRDVQNRSFGLYLRPQLNLLQVNALASLVLFGALSWYFYVPSTLYLYLVLVCFTCPFLVVCRLGWPSSHATSSHYALVPGMVLLFVALCVVRGWSPTPNVPAEWHRPSGDTYYIASLLYNSERILPHYSDALLRLTDELGHDAVFVSIFENDSKDRSPFLLDQLRTELRARGVRFNITTTTLPKEVRRAERIERLSYIRNRAMDPLYGEVRSGLHGRPFDKVIWINDILFKPGMCTLLTQTPFIPSCTRRTGNSTKCVGLTTSGSDSTTHGSCGTRKARQCAHCTPTSARKMTATTYRPSGRSP